MDNVFFPCVNLKCEKKRTLKIMHLPRFPFPLPKKQLNNQYFEVSLIILMKFNYSFGLVWELLAVS